MKEISKELVYNYLIKDLKEELKSSNDPVWHWSEIDYKAFQGPNTKPKRMYYPHGNKVRFATLEEKENSNSSSSNTKTNNKLSINKDFKQSLKTLAAAAVLGGGIATMGMQVSNQFDFKKGKKDKHGNTDKTEEDREYFIIEFDTIDEFKVHALDNGVPNQMINKLEDYVKDEPELQDGEFEQNEEN